MSRTDPERISILETEVRSIKDVLNRIEPMVTETHTKVKQMGAFAAGAAALASVVWGGVLAAWSFLSR